MHSHGNSSFGNISRMIKIYVIQYGYRHESAYVIWLSYFVACFLSMYSSRIHPCQHRMVNHSWSIVGTEMSASIVALFHSKAASSLPAEGLPWITEKDAEGVGRFLHLVALCHDIPPRHGIQILSNRRISLNCYVCRTNVTIVFSEACWTK